MIDVIITMAGLGSRFRKAGWNIPKYMIEVKGKTLFEWSMQSFDAMRDRIDRFVFIAMKDEACDVQEWIETKCKELGIAKHFVKVIDYLTEGQAATAMLGTPYCDPSHELLIYNIDTYVEPDAFVFTGKGCGVIPCFHAEGDHWSFVELDEDGKAKRVAEKERISDNCSVGAYWFVTVDFYKNLFIKYYSTHYTDKREKYIAPMYDKMINMYSDMDVYITDIPKEKVHVLGTPEEVAEFEAK